jgi:hypothetical protein
MTDFAGCTHFSIKLLSHIKSLLCSYFSWQIITFHNYTIVRHTVGCGKARDKYRYVARNTSTFPAQTNDMRKNLLANVAVNAEKEGRSHFENLPAVCV